MPFLVARKAKARERATRRRNVAADADRRLLVRALTQHIPAGILGEVGRAPVPLDGSAAGVEQAGRKLGQRRLATAVGTGQRDDLTATERQARVLEDEERIAVGEGHVVEAA